MFHESFKLLKRNGRALILFEAGVQLVTFVVLIPLIGIITDGAIHLAGLKFLTNATISKLLTSIWTYPLAALIVLIATSQILLHFTGVLTCINASHENRKLTFGELIYELGSSFKRMFSSGAGTLILHLIMLIPAISLPFAGGFISVLGIPDILTRIFSHSNTLILAYSATVLLSMIISVKWMIALPIYVCRDCSFRAARKQSKQLISGNSISILLRMFLWSICFLAVFVVIIILLTGISIGLLSHLGISVSYGSLPLRIIRYLLLFITFIFSVCSVPYLAAGMFVQYETLLSCRKTIGCKTSVKTYRNNKKNRITAILAAISLLWVDGIYIFRLASGDAAVRFVLDTHPLTIAHRGASFSAPENTYYAFIAAMEQGADGIELDVQQTKDGIPVVIHDLNLKRVAGINRKVASFTFDELSQIDVGSWYDDNFKDARIMSLEDVFILTDKKIFMNIELKRGAKNNQLEQKVVSLIEKYDMQNKCCVTSFSYDSLKKIKKYNANIKTGLIMSIATGNFYSLDAADAFSIKSTFISSQVVNNAHQQGKEIYAWTVNNSGEMRRMMNVNADHIITDRPELLLEQIDRNITEDTLIDTALNLIS